MKKQHYPVKKTAVPISEFLAQNNKEINIYHNVISYPIDNATDGYDFQGGLVNPDTHTLITDAILTRHGKYAQKVPFQPQAAAKQPAICVTGTLLFGGILFDNFGHLLLESLGRLWAYSILKDYDPYIIFYVPWGTPQYRKRNNYVRQIFEGFNIPLNRIVFMSQITQIESVIIPAQKYGFGICRKPEYEMMKFLLSFRIPSTYRKVKSPERIYVSRSELAFSKGRPFGEKLFEKYLERNGYAILYPEKTSLFEQLRLYTGASQIIFCDGGATYATILIPELKAELTIIARRRDHRWNYQDITEHFHGFGKLVNWIDEVEAQYEFGMESWDAAADINWHNVSLTLKELGYVSDIFTDTDSEEFRNERKQELLGFIQAIQHNPLFLQYMENNKVQHPILPSQL